MKKKQENSENNNMHNFMPRFRNHVNHISSVAHESVTKNGVIQINDNNNSHNINVASNNNNDVVNYPPGLRFCPFDGELIVYYLSKKIKNEELPHDRIKEVNIYRFNPQDLAANYEPVGDKQWYFFTPRDRKYKNGERPNRAAGGGYWKATGADKPVTHRSKRVGLRKALVFYQGKPPKGVKTNWIMHEYKIDGPKRDRKNHDDMMLDPFVLCRIYHKDEKDSRAQARNEALQQDERARSVKDEYMDVSDCGNRISTQEINTFGDHMHHHQQPPPFLPNLYPHATPPPPQMDPLLLHGNHNNGGFHQQSFMSTIIAPMEDEIWELSTRGFIDMPIIDHPLDNIVTNPALFDPLSLLNNVTHDNHSSDDYLDFKSDSPPRNVPASKSEGK